MHLSAYRKSYHQNNLSTFGPYDQAVFGYLNPFSYPTGHDNNWLLQDGRFETENKYIEKVVRQRLALTEALIKDDVKRYFKTDCNQRMHNRRFSQKTKQHRTSINSPLITKKTQENRNKLERPQSANPNRIHTKLIVKGKGSKSTKGQTKVNHETSRISQNKNQQNCKTQVNCLNKNALQQTQKQSRIQLELAYVKKQLEQKNAIIVDLECKLLKLQSLYQQMAQSKISKMPKKLVLSIETYGSISIAPQKTAIEVSSQIQQIEPMQISLKQTLLSDECDAADCMENNTKQTNLFNQDSFIEKKTLSETNNQICVPSKMQDSVKFRLTQSHVFMTQSKQTLTESILFNSELNESEIDLTLSTSQLMTPSRPRGTKKLSDSGLMCNSGNFPQESVVFELQDQLCDEINQTESCEDKSTLAQTKIEWLNQK